MSEDLVDRGAPIPAYPATIDEVIDDQLRARRKYGPLVQRLGIGELSGLADVVGAELHRRRDAELRRSGMLAGQKIGR